MSCIICYFLPIDVEMQMEDDIEWESMAALHVSVWSAGLHLSMCKHVPRH